MKKYVLLGFIALVMLLAVPAAMAAGAVPVEVKGSIDNPPSLAVAVESPTLDFGPMSTDAWTSVVSTKVTATPTGPVHTWAVSASCAGTYIPTEGGKCTMKDPTVGYLLNPITMAIGSGSYHEFDSETFLSGATSGAFETAKFDQWVSHMDLSGSYNINVDFTGAVLS